MKLIEESVIEEAARSHSNEYWGENYITECKNYNEAGFKAGVSFSLQQLQPFIVEFAEWIDNLYKEFNPKSGQQLLEEFIKDRTMKELEKLLEFDSEEERQEFINTKIEDCE